MTFSGKSLGHNFSKKIEKVVNAYGFQINQKKTRYQSGKGRKIVTGLSVAGKNISIPKQLKRSIRQETHFITKFGYFSHISKKKISDPYYIDSIVGKLTFWLWIEPNNAFVAKTLPTMLKIKSELNAQNISD